MSALCRERYPMSSKSKSKSKSKSAHAAKVAARSTSASGVIRCYVEPFERPDGRSDLRLREKRTGRQLRILSDDRRFRQVAPLTNLLQDCYGHGDGLTDRWSRDEFISVTAPSVTQALERIDVWFDADLTVNVHIATADVTHAPVSVWCFIEEYAVDASNTLGIRLREKGTGRKVEMYGKNREHLARFLASPRFTGAENLMPNLYEKDGFGDYVLVSGGTAVDSYDVLLFEGDDELTYLLGPSADTAYRDAFRRVASETATESHARTARTHFDKGHYREAILAARLAVETGCGGRGKHVKARLANAPQSVRDAGDTLYDIRHVAVHEGDTRVEQPDAIRALQAMTTVLTYLS